MTEYMDPIQESELQFKSRKNELTLESGRVLKRRFEVSECVWWDGTE